MTSLKSVIRQGKQTRSSLRKLRASGVIPAVVYGYGAKNTSVKVDEVEFIKTIREVGRNGVIELGVGSKQSKLWFQIINTILLKIKSLTLTS